MSAMTEREFEEIRDRVVRQKQATTFPDDTADESVYRAAGEHAEFAAAEH